MPAAVVAQPLVVEHERPYGLRELLALPALPSACRDRLVLGCRLHPTGPAVASSGAGPVSRRLDEVLGT